MTVFPLLHLQGNKCSLRKPQDQIMSETEQHRMNVSRGFYFYGHRCRPPSCFVLLFEPDAMGVLCSTDEESSYLLLCLKERQRWIDIDSLRWRLRSVVSRVGTCPTFSTFFSQPYRQKWDAVSVLMNILHKVSDSSSLFLYFCLTLCTLHYLLSFHLLCTADRAFFLPQSVERFKTFIVLADSSDNIKNSVCMGQAVQAFKGPIIC